MKLEWKEGGLLLNEESAGLLTIYHGYVAVHLGVNPEFRFWGRKEDWYDGPIHDFGLGRFLLITWVPR